MFKLTAVVSLLLIGSTLWAASLSCDSCGSECASACGTRHFRSCCFNYLRKKRGPEIQLSSPYQDMKQERPKPTFVVENIPVPEWIAEMLIENRPNHLENTIENHLFDA